MSRRRKPLPEPPFAGTKILRVICTNRGQHAKENLLWVYAVPSGDDDGRWTMMRYGHDGTPDGDSYYEVKLREKCRQCGRTANMGTAFGRVGSALANANPDAETLYLDISVLT